MGLVWALSYSTDIKPRLSRWKGGLKLAITRRSASVGAVPRTTLCLSRSRHSSCGDVGVPSLAILGASGIVSSSVCFQNRRDEVRPSQMLMRAREPLVSRASKSTEDDHGQP